MSDLPTANIKSAPMTVSKRMVKCLSYYNTRPPRAAVLSGSGWSWMTLEDALEREFLHVGESGYHELTAHGRQALVQNARGNGDV
jgi:hypothetical protein